MDEEQNVAALNLNALDPEEHMKMFLKNCLQVFLIMITSSCEPMEIVVRRFLQQIILGYTFLENPNFEANPQRMSIIVPWIIKDTQSSGYETTVSLGFSINDINDAPRPTSAFMETVWWWNLRKLKRIHPGC